MGIILLLIGVLATTSNHMVHVGSKASMIKEVKAENGSGGPESSTTPKYQSYGEKHDVMSASSPMFPEYPSSSMESKVGESRLWQISENDITSDIRSWTMEDKTNSPEQMASADYTQQSKVTTAESPSLSTSDSFSERDILSLSDDSDDNKTAFSQSLPDQDMSQAEAKYERPLPCCTFCRNHFGKNRINFLVEGELTKEEQEELNAFRQVLSPKLKDEDNESPFLTTKDNTNEKTPLIAGDCEVDTLSKNSAETESVMEEFLDIPETLMTILRNLEELDLISLCQSKRPFLFCLHESASLILYHPLEEKNLSTLCAWGLHQYIRRADTSSKGKEDLKNIASEILQYSVHHLETVSKARDTHIDFEKLQFSFVNRMKLLLEPYEGDKPDVICTARQLYIFKIAILAQWSSWQNSLKREEREQILSGSKDFTSYIYSLLNVFTTAFVKKMSNKENNSILYYNRVKRAYWSLSELIRNFFIMTELNSRLIEEQENLTMLLGKGSRLSAIIDFCPE